MLNVRQFFRLFKQSAQWTVARPSIYFSSSADDSNSNRPPNKGNEDESLDALLKATYSSQKSSKTKAKIRTSSPATRTTRHTSKPDSSTIKKGDYQSVVPKKRDEVSVPLENILNAAHNRSRGAGSDAKSEREGRAKSESPTPQSIDLAIKKKKDMSSSELLGRIKKIAEEVSGAAGPKANEVAEDLMKKLQSINKPTEKPLDLNELTFEGHSKDTTDSNLDLLRNKIVSEEQIYKITPASNEPMRRQSQQMEFLDPRSGRPGWRNVAKDLDVSLYPKSKLGIFKPISKENQRTRTSLNTYERLEQRELNLCHSYAPRNWFEQCIQWTEQGKLWHFPINNEQGLEKEAAVSFTEHVFLEDHLEGWCPAFGPVRHFMELVCLGLSRNPYLSVEEKIENIMWYRDYFEKHREILEAAGTLDTGVTKVPALEAQ